MPPSPRAGTSETLISPSTIRGLKFAAYALLAAAVVAFVVLLFVGGASRQERRFAEQRESAAQWWTECRAAKPEFECRALCAGVPHEQQYGLCRGPR